MRKAFLVAATLLLSACQKSDAERCVDAQMTAFDNQNRNAAPEVRDNYKAAAHVACQGPR